MFDNWHIAIIGYDQTPDWRGAYGYILNERPGDYIGLVGVYDEFAWEHMLYSTKDNGRILNVPRWRLCHIWRDYGANQTVYCRTDGTYKLIYLYWLIYVALHHAWEWWLHETWLKMYHQGLGRNRQPGTRITFKSLIDW